MRNKNKDVVIHSLIEIKQNKAESGAAKFDYSEELTLAEKRDQKLKAFIENEQKLEVNCQWAKVVHQECTFMIMVKEGKNAEEVKKHFIEKRNRLGK